MKKQVKNLGKILLIIPLLHEILLKISENQGQWLKFSNPNFSIRAIAGEKQELYP